MELCIRGVVLSPPICRGKQQWNYNECQARAGPRVPLCGVCLRSAISGARQELQSLVPAEESCTVMQSRDRVIVPSPGSGGAVVPTLMTRHTRPTIAEVVLSAAIVNVMQLLKLRSIAGSTKYHSYHQSPHQVTPAAANKKFYFPNLIECRTPPLH